MESFGRSLTEWASSLVCPQSLATLAAVDERQLSAADRPHLLRLAQRVEAYAAARRAVARLDPDAFARAHHRARDNADVGFEHNRGDDIDRAILRVMDEMKEDSHRRDHPGKGSGPPFDPT